MAEHRRRVLNTRKRNRITEIKQSSTAENEVKYEVFLSDATKVTFSTDNPLIAKRMLESIKRGAFGENKPPKSKPPMLPTKPIIHPSSEHSSAIQLKRND